MIGVCCKVIALSVPSMSVSSVVSLAYASPVLRSVAESRIAAHVNVHLLIFIGVTTTKSVTRAKLLPSIGRHDGSDCRRRSTDDLIKP